MDEALRRAEREDDRTRRLVERLRAGRVDPTLVRLAAELGDADAAAALDLPARAPPSAREAVELLRRRGERTLLAAAAAAVLAAPPTRVSAALAVARRAQACVVDPSPAALVGLARNARFAFRVSPSDDAAVTIARRLLGEAQDALGADGVREALLGWVVAAVDGEGTPA